VPTQLAIAESRPEVPSTASDLDFFERHVRPLLLTRCGECHGPDTQEADLRLDSREALLTGGASGAAIVPGDPEKSLLIQAVRRTGDLEMPPEEELTAEQVAALEQWVKRGARWSADEVVAVDRREKARRDHWAFQPVAKPSLPSVRNAAWCRTPIDYFIAAGLESRGLTPSPAADRRTLIRRVTYDLTGLPPTPEEVEAFAGDADPQAYAKSVERLLASPHYGEHWARHWLDVARYSDTKGYVYDREERFFVHAPAYRDWVVRAFNEDLPYDKFLLLQLAADHVAPNDRAALAAMGYLTIGRRFLGVTHDIIDDQIDAVSRGMLGLTVACARCHDHKYDPIPTEDYYSLYGVFRNCRETIVPIAESTAAGEAQAAFENELKKRQEAFDSAMTNSREEAAARVRKRIGEYLHAQLELEKYPEENFNQILTEGDVIPAFARRWQAYLETTADSIHPVFVPWHAFQQLSDEEFTQRAADLTLGFEASRAEINPLVLRAFRNPPRSMRDVVERYAKLFEEIVRQCEARRHEKLCPELPDSDADAFRQVLYGPNSPCEVPDEGIVSTEMYFDTATIEKLWKLQGEVDRWLIQSPEAPPYAVALIDRDWLLEPRVFRRGNPAVKGERVPRQFLEVLSTDDRKPFSQGSGRLELAQAIIAPENPLTARVWVNRVWMHHFGEGLVRTPSDFGLRSEAPSHPELLDWLARELMSNGWSTKALHRLIVHSATYQQCSSQSGDPGELQSAVEVDPENRLLWRMNPHRLTFEEWRDTLLAVTGDLDRRIGGRATRLFPEESENQRRTLYGLVDRQFLGNAFRTFDFANPDLHIPQRSETIVSQQALFAMNHPFVANRARALVAKLDSHDKADASERVRILYRLVYQRDPTDNQLRAALAFLALPETEAPAEQPEILSAWGQLAQVMLIANEIMFVD
jgi:mono/diheme cytochrome c family protein